ncbi:type II secretion system protein [Amycolatopsis mediterranei S699]|uniref:Type II secretion system protein n=2 Tax=Amycolatopsis mediterranei TaxID=33910 RepID=A0A0H3DF29_AMYMU|nr:type II secretion system protein [Amycolatopsis mediterranei]ADJ48812.1 type II secretion system protein [Amycolatopsis mediterranei U32]AEK45752.1 type II secretion system protein [Amycolatopsis mediterranei S699]AFO80521.1 type II secretion system protein [Amycolatopsis mediterranei S699]AGT87649.1 type II secretion system protein [Amycolatopsis mediterranei RB]KDU94079.1 type II secretion system protein [Amycolatopsis mediterranei]
MSTEAVLIVLAITAAIGVILVVAAFAPTRPRLADVLHETPRGSDGLLDAVVVRADRMKLTAKPTDLALVGRSRESFVVQRVGFLLGGALWIPVLTTVLALVGAAPPIVLTGAASVGGAVVGWQLPVVMLKSKVKHARAAFSGALAAYCRLVALGRLGDRGPVEALRYPAMLGTGWAFRRIKLAIDEAVLRGRMPWAGFAELAEETGVRELKDIGHIIASAGQDGASIVDTLRAKAAALDEKQLADRKTGSSVRSDRMDMPVALLGLAFIAFLAFPGLYLMLHT